MKDLAQQYFDEDVREQMAAQAPEPLPLTVRVQPEVKDRIHRIADFLDKSQSQVAADMLEEASFELAVHLAKVYDFTPEDANALLGETRFMGVTK
ncbi:MAG: hypothetical protein LC667_01555 [Thioalkalivibrio sp.]|nr:hypothetical protein [Thioalkalivibrio sp.]